MYVAQDSSSIESIGTKSTRLDDISVVVGLIPDDDGDVVGTVVVVVGVFNLVDNFPDGDGGGPLGDGGLVLYWWWFN